MTDELLELDRQLAPDPSSGEPRWAAVRANANSRRASPGLRADGLRCQLTEGKARAARPPRCVHHIPATGQAPGCPLASGAVSES